MVRSALIALVRGYQVVLSPMMGGACRFEPSCSNYMIEALTVHGAIKGTLLGLWRILRCHPWGSYGYDPVPPRGSWRNVELWEYENEKMRKCENEKI